MFQIKIKELRKEKKYTQQEVADKIGVTRPAYTAYESGKRQPDFNILQSLASLFDVSVDYLLGRTDVKTISDNSVQEKPRKNVDDKIDLEKMLEGSIPMNYAGEDLTKEQEQRVRDILTGILWEEIQKNKVSDADDK